MKTVHAVQNRWRNKLASDADRSTIRPMLLDVKLGGMEQS